MVGHANGQTIDINVNDELELTCLVANAKPVAGVQWYRNDIPFNVADKEDETIATDDDSALPAFRGQGRKSLKSKIKLRPTSSDNGATYACEAKHDALVDRARMRVAVVLSVHCEYSRPK